MIVDSYTMAGGYFIRDSPMGFPELFSSMGKSGVSAAAVMSMRALQADARKGNDFLYDEARGDGRVLPIAVVYPEASHTEVPSLVEDAVARGAAGLAMRVDSSLPFASLAFQKTLSAVSASGLPVVAADVREAGVATQLAESTAGSGYPLVLLGSYYNNLGELLEVLAAYPHVYVDTSWQVTPGCIELMVESGGSSRILFGSGAPLRPVQPALNMVLDADLDESAKRNILGLNALRLFGRGEEADAAEASSIPLPDVKAPSTPAIDVHGHLGVGSRIPMTVRDVEAIEHYAARAGFEYVVCSAPVAYREDLDAGNREMMAKVANRPRLLGSPVISPTHVEASVRWVDRCAQDPKLGHVTWDPDNEGEAYGSEKYMALWAEVAKRGVPVFWNAGSQDLERNVRWEKKLGYMPMIRGGSRAEIEMFFEVGRRHPNLQVIIGHGMGEDGVTVAGQNRNFYLEHSGSYPERDTLRKAIDTLGADKVVYGTDLDLILPAFCLGTYYSADMTPAEESLIMAENARRIMRLP